MRTFIIAEIGPNHNGDIKLARELTRQLAAIGVDAVKFQLGQAERSLSLDAFKADYQRENDNAEDIFEASRKRQLSHDEHRQLVELCMSLGVQYLCTAFDLESLEFLDRELGIPQFKISSGEIFSLDMIEYIASRDKPVIMSTGMATYDEVGMALRLVDPSEEKDLTLLHCVSAYPTPHEDVNLLCMAELRSRFGRPVGFSDHTIGNDTAVAAVALGAAVVEKHVTLDKSLPGPDHKASATVEEFAELVRSIRNVEQALGEADRSFSETEREVARVARKSIVSLHDLVPGQVLAEDDICYRRPGTGYLPIERDLILGKRVARLIQANRVIRKEDLLWD